MSLLLPTDPRQAELQELQKEYRHMELNRRAYAEESQSLLRKQQSTIDKLRKDNEALKNDIALIMRGANRPMSTIQQDFIQGLTDQVSMIDSGTFASPLPVNPYPCPHPV